MSGELILRPRVVEPDAILPPERLVRLTVADHPVRVDRRILELPPGLTVRQMIEIAVPDPVYREHVVAFVRGRVIPREWWSRVRLKEGSHLELRVVAHGGGDGGKTLRIILIVAVAILAYSVPYIGAFLGSTFIFVGAPLALAVSAVVAATGILLVNALVPVRPPKLDKLSGPGGSPQLFIEGARNTSRPFAPIPVVLGRYRVTPPYGAAPYTELIGGDQILSMIVVWGIGPLQIDTASIRVGETLLSEFSDVETEHREGFPDDEPLTLYPGTVVQEDISVSLIGADALSADIEAMAGAFTTRTSAPNATELSCDFVFPYGIATIYKGRPVIHTIGIDVQFREVGTTDWFALETTAPNGGAYAVNTNNAADFYNANVRPTSYVWKVPPYSGSEVVSGSPPPYIANAFLTKGINFQNATLDPWRVGVTWRPLVPNVQYEVRVRKSSPEVEDILGPGPPFSFIDRVHWVTLRTITNEDPINSRVPIAKSAIRIRATDQLSGVIDTLTAIITSYGPIWTGTSWLDDQPTNNPASLFRIVLQGAGNATPLPDDRLDLDALADWYDFCEERNFTFNMVRDFASSVWETLADVASAGRASPTQVDGKWSVVIERLQPFAVSHITPRNSFDFKMERVYIDQPHAWRTRFPNEDQDYRQDERRVYADGYTIANATRFEGLELPGVTDPDQVYRLGRFRIAQAEVSLERWSFQQDMEFLTYRRGDRVAITHDVLLTGLASARVKEIAGGGGSDTGVVLDETVTMEAGSYGVAIRTVAGGQITRQVTTVVGDTNTLTFASSVPSGSIEVGNIVGFGVLGEETDDATVIAIAPDADFKARIACVPYRASIFDVDAETPTGFDTGLTPSPVMPPLVIVSVKPRRVGVAVGSVNPVIFSVVPFFAAGIDPTLSRIGIQGRIWGSAQPYAIGVGSITEWGQTPTTITIVGPFESEIWDFRLRWVVPSLNLVGPWTYVCGDGSAILGSAKASYPVSGSIGNTGTDVTIPVPRNVGVSPGDMLVAFLAVTLTSTDNFALPFIPPGGWPPDAEYHPDLWHADFGSSAGEIPGNGPYLVNFWHIVQEGDPAEWTWTAAIEGNSRAGMMYAFRGLDLWDSGDTGVGPFFPGIRAAPPGYVYIGAMAVSAEATDGGTEQMVAVEPLVMDQQHVSTGSATGIACALGVAASRTVLTHFLPPDSVDPDDLYTLENTNQIVHPEVDPVTGASDTGHVLRDITLAPTEVGAPTGSPTPCQFVMHFVI